MLVQPKKGGKVVPRQVCAQWTAHIKVAHLSGWLVCYEHLKIK